MLSVDLSRRSAQKLKSLVRDIEVQQRLAAWSRFLRQRRLREKYGSDLLATERCREVIMEEKQRRFWLRMPPRCGRHRLKRMDSEARCAWPGCTSR